MNLHQRAAEAMKRAYSAREIQAVDDPTHPAEVIRDLLSGLATARAELEITREQRKDATEAAVRSYAKGRALAFEEAARQADAHGQFGLAVVLRNLGLAALAPLESGLVAVRRDTIDSVIEVLGVVHVSRAEDLDLIGDTLRALEKEVG